MGFCVVKTTDFRLRLSLGVTVTKPRLFFTHTPLFLGSASFSTRPPPCAPLLVHLAVFELERPVYVLFVCSLVHKCSLIWALPISQLPPNIIALPPICTRTERRLPPETLHAPYSANICSHVRRMLQLWRPVSDLAVWLTTIMH